MDDSSTAETPIRRNTITKRNATNIRKNLAASLALLPPISPVMEQGQRRGAITIDTASAAAGGGATTHTIGQRNRPAYKSKKRNRSTGSTTSTVTELSPRSARWALQRQESDSVLIRPARLLSHKECNLHIL